jgi:hypothetical protein
MVGERVGKLTIESVFYEGDVAMANCRCDCGRHRKVSSRHIGTVKHCGHHPHAESFKHLNRSKDMAGRRFGRLLVLSRVENNDRGSAMFLCRCDCGAEKVVAGYKLRVTDPKLRTHSCGCYNKEVRPKGRDHYKWDDSLTDEDRAKKHRGDEEFRVAVFERDGYVCQVCAAMGGVLNAHHKDNWRDFPEERFDPDNGITLCEECHQKFHKDCGYKHNTAAQFVKWLGEQKQHESTQTEFSLS